MIYGFNIYKHNPSMPVNVEIATTNQKYQLSSGYDIELFNVKADNQNINFKNMQIGKKIESVGNMDNYWEKRLLIKPSINIEDSSIKFHTKASKLYFIFQGYKDKGIVKITVNNKNYLFDTFMPFYYQPSLFNSAQLITINVNEKLSTFVLMQKNFHILSYFIVFFTIFYYLSLILFSININVPTKNEKINLKSGIVYALPILLGGIFALLIFFPLIIPFDGLTIWKYAHTLHFCNEHPVLYSYIIHLLTKIWDNPAIIGITQILIISFFIGYFFCYLEKYGFPQKILLLCAIVIGFTPYNMIMSVSLWKDVLYSYFILSLTLSSLIMLIEKENFYKIGINNFIWLFSLIMITMLRYEGILIGFVYFVILFLLFRKNFKHITINICLYMFFLLILISFVKRITYMDLPFIHNQVVEVPIHQISAIFHFNGNVTQDDKQNLNKILPVYKFEKFYTQYLIHNFIFNTELLTNKIDKKELMKIYFSLLKDKKNCLIVFKDWLIINSYVFKFLPNPEGIIYRYSCDFKIDNDLYLSKKFNVSDNTLRQSLLFPQIYNKIQDLFNVFSKIIDNPFIPFFIFIFFGFIFILKNTFNSILFFVPSLFSFIFLSISLPQMYPRYVFYFYLLYPIAIMLSLIKIKNKE
ncbi:hypothetical protein IJG14_00410 [bacterium]|nr:hypothetical protein [bacterium]